MPNVNDEDNGRAETSSSKLASIDLNESFFISLDFPSICAHMVLSLGNAILVSIDT